VERLVDVLFVDVAVYRTFKMEVENECATDMPTEAVEDDAGSMSADGSSDSGSGGVTTDDIRLQDSEEQAPLNGTVSSSSSTPSTPDVESWRWRWNVTVQAAVRGRHPTVPSEPHADNCEQDHEL